MSVRQGPVASSPAPVHGGVLRVVSMVLGSVVLALIVAGPPLGVLARQWSLSTSGSVAAVATLCVVGMVIAWHPPGNRWAGSCSARPDPRCSAPTAGPTRCSTTGCITALPLGAVAVLLQPAWTVTFTLFGLMILLYPDGRLPSPRWRLMLWPYLALAALYLGGALVITAGAIVGHRVRLDAGGTLTIFDHPAGGDAWWGTAQTVFLLALAASWLIWLGRQAFAFRHAAWERRLQLKWLLTGAAAGIILAVGGFVVSITVPALNGAGSIAGTLGILALPVSLGLGILKFRLYDIDRIISRTLAYAIVTGLLVGVYAGLVLLATHVLSVKSPVAVAAATLAAAALFNPVRIRVQRVVDRRFNRARYDADAAVAAFAARLQDAVHPDAVHADLLAAVCQTLEPAHVSVWLRER